MMKPAIVILFVLCSVYSSAQSKKLPDHNLSSVAQKFMASLQPAQKERIFFAFDDEERYRWNYVPIERKGIAWNELTATQHNAALQLLQSALSPEGLKKTRAVMQLETVLKKLEGRGSDDHYRDTGKYYIAIFGTADSKQVWGWRLDGHHVSFSFTADGNKLVAGTPGFLGANPAVVPSGSEKGLELLKDETALGFRLLYSLDSVQKQKAIFSKNAPNDIITRTDRKAIIKDKQGILYSELGAVQQGIFRQLLQLYLHRYEGTLYTKMMKEIENNGIDQLRFAWAGDQQPGIGHPHYYRIQGPTIIIEYDNTQNNANHVHTVIRDLKNDFGGDQLLEHYQKHKH